MLKKLFISLIILSTLASEGIMNFPGNIYNFLTCLNTDSGLNINLKEKVETTKETNEIKNYYNGTFNLTLNSLKKLIASSDFKYLNKSKTINNYEDILLNKYNLSACKVTLGAIPETKKTLVLFRTDTSPPII